MEDTQLHPKPQFLPLQVFGVLRKQNTRSFTWQSALNGLVVFAVFIGFMAVVQFSTPDMPDNDGFYHIKMAYLMRTEGLKPAFQYLPLSILNEREFYDHHFLFHVALIPFTFGDLRLGAKWAAVLFASLAFLTTWLLFKNQRIPYASLWAFGLAAVSEAFIYRMSITRAQSLSLAVLMLSLYFLLNKKHLALGVLAMAYVWLYDAFPLILIFAAGYTAAAWLIERRFDLRPVIYATAGIAAGLVFNPYFPHNIVFAYMHILPKLVETGAVRVGNEWYPYETATLLKNSPLALAAFLSGVLGLGFSGRKIDLRTLVGFGIACLFGLMLFQSRRFVEYFPAFALVFAAFAWAPVLEKFTSSTTERSGLFGRFSSIPIFMKFEKALPVLILAAALSYGAWTTLIASQKSLQTSKPYQTYAGASAWLQANTPERARVFQTDWDDFPRLFFYNTHNTYLIGLDPTYMSIYDKELFAQWVAITQGKVDDLAAPISQDFGSEYIFSDLRHTDFLEKAYADSGLVEVYRDPDSVVFAVINVGK